MLSSIVKMLIISGLVSGLAMTFWRPSEATFKALGGGGSTLDAKVIVKSATQQRVVELKLAEDVEPFLKDLRTIIKEAFSQWDGNTSSAVAVMFELEISLPA